MTTVEYTPMGVCSKKMIVECDAADVITDVKIVGGCPGNTLGVSKLCIGKTIDEVINTLEGVRCGLRPTSCPDQLSKALRELKAKNRS